MSKTQKLVLESDGQTMTITQYGPDGDVVLQWPDERVPEEDMRLPFKRSVYPGILAFVQHWIELRGKPVLQRPNKEFVEEVRRSRWRSLFKNKETAHAE